MNTVNIDGPGRLLVVLGQVPEHRKARSIRHEIAALLAVATAAVLSGADSTAAIAQYSRTRLPQHRRRTPRRRLGPATDSHSTSTGYDQEHIM